MKFGFLKNTIITIIVFILISCQSLELSDPGMRAALVDPVINENVRFKINRNDYQYLLEMIYSRSPKTRLAGLHLAEYNMTEELIRPVLDSTNDEYEKVSSEARDILVRNSSIFCPWVTERLGSLDYENLNPSLEIIKETGYVQAAEEILELFEEDIYAVNHAAAETLAGLLPGDHELMAELKNSEEIRKRKAYYIILSYKSDSTVIPEILNGLNDADPEIWGTATTALYNFGPDVIPYLQAALEPYNRRVAQAAIQIAENNNMVEAIPLLLDLTRAEYGIISQRSSIVLVSFGEDFFPYAREAVNNRSAGLDTIFWILEKSDSEKVIDTYIQMIKDNDLEIANRAFKGLSRWGEKSWKGVETLFETGSGAVKNRTVIFLRNQSAVNLISDKYGNLYRDRVFRLIYLSSLPEIEAYLERSGLKKRYWRGLNLLKQAHAVSGNMNKEINETEQEEGGYRALYREWEEKLKEAEELRSRSRELTKRFFSEQEDELLSEKKDINIVREKILNEAESLEERMRDMAGGREKEEQERIVEMRQRLADIWLSLPPEFKDIGRIIYSARGYDGDEIVNTQRLVR